MYPEVTGSKIIIIFGPMESSMFDTLLSLPLFQGMTLSDFNSLLQKVKLDFMRYQDGEKVIESGERCVRFAFLINGSIESTRTGNSGLFTFRERIDAPYLIEPYSMFGRAGQYLRSYSTIGQASFLFIDKLYVYTEIGKYNICRMNLLNILSGRVQQMDKAVWSIDGMTLHERMISFIKSLADQQNGEKTINIKMNDMATIMDATRINVSRELNAMEAAGLVELNRSSIHIPRLEELK